MTCVIENLSYIKNLDEIKLNETINLECLYRNASKFQDKHLKEFFNNMHEEMFGCCVYSAQHTRAEWKEFFDYFLNLEIVQGFDESTYDLKITEA